MATKTIRAEIVNPNRSHWLELATGRSRATEPFSKEELYPIVRVIDVPRVGTVRAEMSADRYTHSAWDEAKQAEIGEKMGDWRIVLRSVRNDDEDAREASGIGPATWTIIRDAAEPVVREYLASDEYKRSRRIAASRALVREIREARHSIDRIRLDLEACAPYLAPAELSRLKTLAERMYAVHQDLDAEPLA